MVESPIRVALIFLSLAFASTHWQVVEGLVDPVDGGGSALGDHPLLQEENLRKLLQNDAVSQSDLNLLFGARDGNIESVKAALKSGAKGDERTPTQRFTPLIFAARGGHGEIVDLLVESGVDVNAQTRSGMTALWSGAFHGYSEVVKTLVVDGEADVNLANVNGTTPLYVASQRGHSSVVRFLLRKGANPETRSDTGATPLLVAAQSGRAGIVTLLAEEGADVNVQKDGSGQSALWSASFLNHLDVVRALVEQGASVNLQAEDDSTPMFAAAQQGWAEVVSELVKEGANVNLARNDGLTPLHIAVVRGHTDVVEVLIEAGADITVVDAEGRTAADVVKVIMGPQNADKDQESMLAMLEVENPPEAEPLPPPKKEKSEVTEQTSARVRPIPKSPRPPPPTQKTTSQNKEQPRQSNDPGGNPGETDTDNVENAEAHSSEEKGSIEPAPAFKPPPGEKDKSQGESPPGKPEKEMHRTRAVDVVGRPPKVTILEAEDSVLHNGQKKHLRDSGGGVTKANVAIITITLMVSVLLLVTILSVYAVKRRKANERKRNHPLDHELQRPRPPDQGFIDEACRASGQMSRCSLNRRENAPAGGFESNSFDWPQTGDTPQRDAMESRRSDMFADEAVGSSNPLSAVQMHPVGLGGVVPEWVRTWNWVSDDRPSTEQPSMIPDENMALPEVFRMNKEDLDSSPFHHQFSWNEKLQEGGKKKWHWTSFWRRDARNHGDGDATEREGGQGSKNLAKVVSATTATTEAEGAERVSGEESDLSAQRSPGLQSALQRAQDDRVFYAVELPPSHPQENPQGNRTSNVQVTVEEVLERRPPSPRGDSGSLRYNAASGGGDVSMSDMDDGNGGSVNMRNVGNVTKVSGSCVRMTADEGAGTAFPGSQGDRGRRKIRVLYKD
ncbi:hypothetical protein BSKO_08371 [Bryopsis sp. KO-2023]|nr:hypothetical protein BSKO_08371 [Bryopsis sp. KO-2023]